MSEPMIDISFSVKEDILFSLQETQEEFTKEVLLLSALLFYRKGKLSLGKAAELAGYNRMDFIQKLQEEQEYLFDYSETEMNDIFDDVVKIK